MRRWLWAVMVGAILAWSAATAPAQGVAEAGAATGTATGAGIPTIGNPPVPYSGALDPARPYGAFEAPGMYGVAYGYPSFGVPRTYTSFSSSYGAGYGYGYAPYGFVPGRYGVGLWRPGFVAPGYIYGASYYRTFPVPYRPYGGSVPPLGLYAPGYGPPGYVAW